MGYIDVAIPGLIGLLLVAAPHLLVRPTGNALADATTMSRLRGVGALLLLIAAGYLMMKISRGV